MGIQHCYIESAASWNREWSDNGSDMEEMSEEEREEAESAARIEMEQADNEAADYRWQEQRDALAGWNDTLALGAYDNDPQF